MQASIELDRSPAVQYLLRVGDTCLILAQRLGEWCGHAPVLEEDIAMSNIALDLVGQARALLTRAGQLEAHAHDEDQLAFLRDERDYFNVTLAELPRGDFGFSVLRNAMAATWLKLLWERLASSSDAEVAAIAAKALKEARYHQQHSGDWVVRLGDGTTESNERMNAALKQLWLYVPELFDSDAVDEEAAASGLGPRWSDLREPWFAEMTALLEEATLAAPAEAAFLSTGKRGVHSEHMGYVLAEMQHLQACVSGRRVVTVAGVSNVDVDARVDAAWDVLATVLDPEVPALSIRDLGIVRDVLAHDDGLEIVLTPTYSGCPATEVIERSVLDAIDAADLGPARVVLRRAPAWTTDWISDEGRRKLTEYGIAPPGPAGPGAAMPIRFMRRSSAPAADVACPRCGSHHTERLSAFGSTACKALYRCLACREPFEHFKPR